MQFVINGRYLIPFNECKHECIFKEIPVIVIKAFLVPLVM